MPRSLKIATICLHLSAVLYLLLGVYLLVTPSFGTFTSVFLGIFSVILAILVEVIVKGLNSVKRWAWIAALILFCLYVPSLFILLGILGLVDLLRAETRANFFPGTGKAKQPAE